MRLFHGFIAAAALALVSASGFALDNQQPDPELSVGQCIESGGTVEQEPGSAIRACCMDSEVTGIRGCYICNYKWEDCVWDPAYSGKTQGTPPVGTLGTVNQDIITNPQIFEMQPQLHGVTGSQPQTLETDKQTGTAPKIKKKLQVVKPLTLLAPVPLDCSYSPSAGLSSVRVRNSTEAVIGKGRQVGWRTAAGDQGARALPDEFYPGKEMKVGASQTTAPGCTAWLVPERPQLLQ
jgi:hypothetical protein